MVCIAEQSVSSGLAAVAVASVPLWIGLFATLRGQRSNRLEWLGLGIGFVGVLWLNAGSSLTASPTALVALLVAPVAWAFGSVWSKGRPAVAVHGRGGADAVRRRDDGRRRPAAGRAPGCDAHDQGPVRGRLPGRFRLDHRLLRLRLAAAPR